MLNRKKLYEQVLETIVSRIRSHEYQPGSLLPTENQLAEEFGVSKNCVREAIKCLAVGGIAVSRAGKGTFLVDEADKLIAEDTMVLDISKINSYSELMEIRLLIEPDAASFASKRHSQKQLQELAAIVEAMESTISSKSNVDLGQEFHNSIMEMTGNRYIFKVIKSIAEELSHSRRYLLNEDSSVYDVYSIEHKKIFCAIAKRDAESAKHLMYLHLKHAKETFID